MAKFLSLKRKGKTLDGIGRDAERNLGPVTKENGDDLLATARRRVHKLTRQTEKSLRVQMVSATEGKLTGQHGAYWEEYVNDERAASSIGEHGGRNEPPHVFAAPSVEEVRPRAQQRVREAIEGAIDGRGR